MESQKYKYGISRFNSIGGITCYMNSILHILQQVPIFADYIYTSSFLDNLKKKKLPIKSTVTYELYRLFTASMNHDDMAITPTSFKNIIGEKNEMWNEHNHQDSQEFLSFLIATLEDEIGTVVKFIPNISQTATACPLELLATMAWQNFQKREYSPLKDIFNGLYYIQTKCSCCSNISHNFEPFTTLQIAIPVKTREDIQKDFSIDECLQQLSKEERLDKDNMYNCEICGIKNRALKRVFLWKTPKVLIIHIKRFIVNNFGVMTKKLVNNIQYPVYDFNINNYIHPKSPFKTKSIYDLVGVNLHQEFGNFGTNSGHYTSLVKNRLDDNWYLFNDGREPCKATKLHHIQNKNAYLLFYYNQG